MLLLSRFSHVRLCVTPKTATHQPPLSLGLSRQEYWSGLPFPSPMHACMLSRFSPVRLCVTPWTAAHKAPLSTGFSRQEYWSGLPLPSPCYDIVWWMIKCWIRLNPELWARMHLRDFRWDMKKPQLRQWKRRNARDMKCHGGRISSLGWLIGWERWGRRKSQGCL